MKIYIVLSQYWDPFEVDADEPRIIGVTFNRNKAEAYCEEHTYEEYEYWVEEYTIDSDL